MSTTERYRCPYTGCGFEGTDAQVDDHRTTGVHDDQPQAGSNIRAGTAAAPQARNITFRTEHKVSRDDLVNALARRAVSLGDWAEESPHGYQRGRVLTQAETRQRIRAELAYRGTDGATNDDWMDETDDLERAEILDWAEATVDRYLRRLRTSRRPKTAGD